MKVHPTVVAGALADLDDGPRTEITRVRTTPAFKAEFAKCSASLGLPSATHAYLLMQKAMQKQQAKGTYPPAARTGAARRPVRAMNGRRQV